MNQSQLNNESDCSYLTMNTSTTSSRSVRDTGIEVLYPPTNSFMSIISTKYKITKKVKRGFPTTSENGRVNGCIPRCCFLKIIIYSPTTRPNTSKLRYKTLTPRRILSDATSVNHNLITKVIAHTLR